MPFHTQTRNAEKIKSKLVDDSAIGDGKTLVYKAATDSIVYEASGGSIPSGVIVLWSGLVSNIPTGWHLCDGLAGTPDLREKFIKGASGGDEGASGGSTTLTHAGSAVADHPALTHSGGAVDAHSGMAVQNHSDVTVPATATAAVKIGTAGASAAAQTHTHTITSIVHSVTQAINHVFTQPSQHAIQAHGVTQPSNHTDVQPPYYKLAYIMKT